MVFDLSLAALAFGASMAATGLVLAQLRRRAILDHPNQRSSHSTPTPRGGGLAVMAVIVLVAGGVALSSADWPAMIVLGAAGILSAISWWDDLKDLPAATRLTAQALAVAIGLGVMGDDLIIAQGLLPPWLDHAMAALLWLWFINLFNFMDGIDGISGVEAISIAAGLWLVAQMSGASGNLDSYALVAGSASLGFLYWNWPPARIFLGDVGSIGLGFVFGWLLLLAAGQGHWAAALILPLYYLADASLTLIRRVTSGEAFWRAHREHFYQRAARGWTSHRRPVAWLMALQGALIGLSSASLIWPEWAASCLLFAALPTGLLLWYFGRSNPIPREAPLD
jgi:UDP-N-acetylmuramyl pentapeptide phosphotransferase/UDP-N-acetylglucosamine-1-phosphate transferase